MVSTDRGIGAGEVRRPRRAVGFERSWFGLLGRSSLIENEQGGTMPNRGTIWTIVGILLIVALLIYIF